MAGQPRGARRPRATERMVPLAESRAAAGLSGREATRQRSLEAFPPGTAEFEALLAELQHASDNHFRLEGLQRDDGSVPPPGSKSRGVA